jgi:hypothetical protein
MAEKRQIGVVQGWAYVALRSLFVTGDTYKVM